jgi:radical SAM protein with 4Fe4S-binding SPASM domain
MNIYHLLYSKSKSVNRRFAILKAMIQDDSILTMPLSGSFQNSLLCNLRCPHCQTHGVERDRISNNAITMPNELLRKVAQEVLPTADEYLLTVSGEPLASPKFAQIVQEFLPYGAKLEVHTNGTLFTPEKLAVLIPASRGIHISIDGATQFMIEATRKGASYKKLLHNIRLLARTNDMLPDKTRTSITFGYTIMGSNIRELPEIVKLASILGVKKIYGYFVVVHHDHLGNEDVRNHKSLYNYYYEKAVKVASNLGVFISIPQPFEGVPASAICPIEFDKMIIDNFPTDYLEKLESFPDLVNFLDFEAIDLQAKKIKDVIISQPKLLRQNINFVNIYSLVINLIKKEIYYRYILIKYRRYIEKIIQRRDGQLIKYCESIFKRIYVSPTGDITPCCYIYRPLGNVYNSPVSDIWNGVAFNDFRRKFLSNEPEQECINCHNVSYLSIGELYSKINRSNFVFNLFCRLITVIKR